MARFSFGIFGQSNNQLMAGLKVYIRDESTGNIIASTEKGYQYTIHDNHDGTYYVDELPTGKYSVLVGSDQSVQDEMYNIVVCGDEVIEHISDSSLHTQIDDSITSTTKTWSSEKINQELGKKADDSEIVNIQAELDDKADINHTHPELENYIASVDSQHFEVDENKNLKLKDNDKLTSGSYIEGDKSVLFNLYKLDQRLANLILSSGASAKGYVLYTETSDNNNPTEIPNGIINQTWKYIPFFKLEDLNLIRMTFRSWNNQNYAITFNLYIDIYDDEDNLVKSSSFDVYTLNMSYHKVSFVKELDISNLTNNKCYYIKIYYSNDNATGDSVFVNGLIVSILP